jgi:hypothetical protein
VRHRGTINEKLTEQPDGFTYDSFMAGGGAELALQAFIERRCAAVGNIITAADRILGRE